MGTVETVARSDAEEAGASAAGVRSVDRALASAATTTNATANRLLIGVTSQPNSPH